MDQQPWFHAEISGWPTFLPNDTFGLDMDGMTDSTSLLNVGLNCLESPFDPSLILGPFNGAFAPLEGPNMGLFDFGPTIPGPSTDFPPINKSETDVSSPQSGTLAEVSREQFSFNNPPSIGNCTSLAASPLTSLSSWSEPPVTLQTWPPSNLMADHMFLPPDLYGALSDPLSLGALGQGNQPAIFPTLPPAFSPQSFGNLEQHEEELDQDSKAPILGGKTGQKLTKAGNVPMREQRKEQRLEKCPLPECQFSTKGFAYSSEVGRHVRTKHKSEIENLSTAEKTRLDLFKNPPEKYRCTEEGCLKEYGRRDHLRRHSTKKHGWSKQKRGRQAI